MLGSCGSLLHHLKLFVDVLFSERRGLLNHLNRCGSRKWCLLLVTLFDLCLGDRFPSRWKAATRGINLDVPEVELAEETIHECALLCARASPSTPPASSRSTRTAFRHPPVFASTSNSTALRTASPPSGDCRRIARCVRNRRSVESTVAPMIESRGPVIPRSVTYPVSPGSIRASAV